MILVFQDDGTVRPLGSVAQANQAYESIDVENGEYIFLDERGFVLKPVLESRSEKKLFGLISISSHVPFRLEPTEEKNTDLLIRLGRGEFPIDKGPMDIGSLGELRRVAPLLFQNEE